MEEAERIRDLASKFDSLLKSPGWIEVLHSGAEKVNSELAEATRDPYAPENQRIHVIRWNAMREILDHLQNYTHDIRKQRDEINQLQKEEEEQERMLNEHRSADPY